MSEYKNYKIVSDGTFGNLVVKGIGKGPIPLGLRGSFTSVLFARKAIDQYGKEVKNVEEVPTR